MRFEKIHAGKFKKIIKTLSRKGKKILDFAAPRASERAGSLIFRGGETNIARVQEERVVSDY